jgi:drug/metabolite transporter (DMT)-like permease
METKPYFNKFNLMLLLIATVIWGFSFSATKWIVGSISPVWLTGIRFSLAAIISLPLLLFIDHPKKDRNYIGPILCGIFMFLAVVLQVEGIKYTSVAKSGFITAFYAFFTPMILLFLDKKKLSWDFWVLLITALLGIMMMCELSWDKFNRGDVLTLGSAFLCACHIYTIGRFANRGWNPLYFNFVQNITIGILGVGYGYFSEGIFNAPEVFEMSWMSVGLGIVLLSFFCTFVAFSVQIYAQQSIPAHVAGLVFLLESPFSALFGYMILKETLTEQAIYGAMLVIVAVASLPYMKPSLEIIKNAFRRRRSILIKLSSLF